ncbi:bifunctional folylpolyglutamate synthase/dihydrofolate synthase [Thermosulfuriphilus sp.]
MTFEQACSFLNSFQFHGMKLGLERITALCKALRNPHLSYPVIHIAGTNGKGSTGAMLARMLQESGYRVGFYSSPHLFSVRERFRINGREISPDSFARIMGELHRLIASGYKATYFELTTALAFRWFADMEVELAVVECGLGGTYDATNIVRPVLCIITNVGLDHQAYLGNNKRKIARDKAGIIKEGSSVITGARGAALEEIASCAQASKARLYVAGCDFRAWGRKRLYFSFPDLGVSRLGPLNLGLKGRYQFRNASLALAAIHLLKEKGYENVSPLGVKKGLERACWPGRFEIVENKGRRIILDGAHNLDGIRALKQEILAQGFSRDLVLLFGATDEGGDKPYFKMLKVLAEIASKIVITVPQGPRKPVSLKIWKMALPSIVSEKQVFLEENPLKALRLAQANLSPSGGLLVCGSLYLVGQIRKALIP